MLYFRFKKTETPVLTRPDIRYISHILGTGKMKKATEENFVAGTTNFV